jgi:hypothetical protein
MALQQPYSIITEVVEFPRWNSRTTVTVTNYKEDEKFHVTFTVKNDSSSELVHKMDVPYSAVEDVYSLTEAKILAVLSDRIKRDYRRIYRRIYRKAANF